MAFRVEVTSQAEQDADTILEWLLSQHAGEAGLRWFMRLREAIYSLAEMPGRCPLAPENASVPSEMRQLLYGRKPHVYRILFTIEGDVVYVLRIRHGHRQHLGAPSSGNSQEGSGAICSGIGRSWTDEAALPQSLNRN
jgi:plasmid stabilization system protein ParE